VAQGQVSPDPPETSSVTSPSSSGHELWRLDAHDLATLVASREITCREAVEAHLERIEDAGGATNAVTTRLDEQALDAADARDREVLAGAGLGPLHGVPVTVKESLDLAGSPTTMGNPSRASVVPAVTGPEAEGLLRAGAVVVGRTNAPDFSLRLHTDNDLHGPTRNPWNPGRSPGGSGGGEAVAVATGMSALGLGGDVGGSLRTPAHWCGVTTIKPTPGRVPSATSIEPREPTLSLALMTSYGPFARSVEDARIGYRALVRPDARDPWAVPVAAGEPAYSRPTAMAVLDAPDVDPAIRRAVESAAQVLSDAGFDHADEQAPSLDRVTDVWARLFLGDVAFTWPTVEPLLSDGTRRWLNDAFAVHPPPTTRDGLLATYAERHALAGQWSAFQERVPLVVAPPMAIPAPPVGFDVAGESAIAELLERGRFIFLANLLGLPAAVVPVGVADGVPVAVQLIGPRFGEELCLAAAEILERTYRRLTPIDPR
jgi:amidase